MVYILQKKRKMKRNLITQVILMMFIFLFIFQIQLIISQDLGFGKGGGEIIKSLGDLNRMNDSWLREKWLGEFLGKQINRGEKRQYTSEPIQVNFSEIKNDEKQKQIKEPVLKIDPEILREFDKNNQIELKLVIELRDESNISLVGTKEEEVELLKQKLEWYKSKIDEVLLNYSNNSNFVVLDKTSRGFVVMVNKQGFELFVNNTKILKIRLDKPVYPTEKDYTATYDLELLEKFNESNMVNVMVELKDESGIIVNIVNGTKEEKREQLRQIDEWFQPRIDEVLSDYSNDSNIKVSSRMLRGFVVNVNERGFWRLVNDTRIVKISPSRIGYIAEEDEEDFINTSKFI